MSLISAGVNLRRQGLLGLTEAARLETQREIAEKNLESAKKATEMQTLGTGAGIGGAIGVNKALAARGATEAGGGFVSSTGGMAGMSQSANAGAAASEAVRNTAANVSGVFSPAGGLAQGANAGAVVGGQTAAGGSVVGGQAIGGAAGGGAAGAGGAAAGSSGVMATLSTIAAPIAIGIGAAFLLNKLLG